MYKSWFVPGASGLNSSTTSFDEVGAVALSVKGLMTCWLT